MAVTFDAASTRDLGLGLTWAHTVTPTGGNRVLVVDCTAGSATPTAGTYGGVALTSFANGGSNTLWRRFRLINPPTGANNIVLTGGSSVSLAIASSWLNVDQTTPLIQSVQANGNSATASVTQTATAASDLVIATIIQANQVGGVAPGAGQTEHAEIAATELSSESGTGAGVVMSGTITSGDWDAFTARLQNSNFGGASHKNLASLGAGRLPDGLFDRDIDEGQLARDRWTRRPSGLWCEEDAGRVRCERSRPVVFA